MRLTPAVFALLLVAPVSFAQTSPAPSAGSTDLVAPPRSFACPIDFFAQRTSPTSILRRAEDDRAAPSPGQVLLALSFSSGDSRVVTAVAGILHGPGLQAHVETASSSATADRTAPFHLRRTASDNLRSSSVTSGTLGAVRWIELTGIRFADGSQWRPTASSQCRATPNGILPI